MRHVIHFGLGLALVLLLWWALQRVEVGASKASLPEGWAHLDPPGEVCALVLDPEVENCLWTGGRDGLIRVDTRSFRILPPLPGQPRFSHVWALFKTADGRIWIGHNGGLSIFASGHWSHLSKIGNRDTGPVRSFCLRGPDEVLAGTDHGLASCRAGHWKWLKLPSSPVFSTIDALLVDSLERLWVGSAAVPDGGLLLKEEGRWRSISVPAEIPHPSVNQIVQLEDASICCATGFANQGGAAFFDGENWTQWTVRDGLAGPKLRSVFQDRSGWIFFGSEYDGLGILRGSGDWSYIRPGEGLGGKEVKVVVQSGPEIYWLGTDRGLTRIRLE